ncbi:hydrogenase expression/formation C-terminal domain-containing protein [Uliginosibacterium gangwonense]|uniref:hydrogenase expression/formation C-terminal domain-containing protein n=1 Tax=Uliginosibacterium gangwonense TaxID=392736 RepID=UPI000373D5EF|nr:hydrogenase expression/formation C-terminal domain-containing protein [Uliginosibacterium gangwonense]
MNKAITIPIAVQKPNRAQRVEQLHHDILEELAQLVSRFLSTGEKGVIDLRIRAQDFLADEMQPLRERLGKGEVSAKFEGFGHVDIEETSYPGIWWLSYFDAEEQLETQQIEVAWFPNLLKAQAPDIRQGAARLAAELLGSDASPAVETH